MITAPPLRSLRETSGPQSEPQTLLALSSRGTAWALSSQIIAQICHLVIRIILARLLAPGDFGLLAMVIVFLSVAEILSEMSFGAAIVQRKDLTEEHRNAAFWSIGAMSCLLAALFALAAPVVGWFYGNSEVVPLVRVMGLGLMLGFPNAVFHSFFSRDMDFKTLGMRKIGSTLVGGAGGITAALAGVGVWALVINHLLNATVASAWMVLRTGWRPSWSLSATAVRELWDYSRHLLGASLVNFFNRNLDNLLIGRYLGSGALGYYSFAYQGVAGPLQYLSRPVAVVGFPAFARVQSDIDKARRAYLQTLSAVSAVTMPFIGGLIFLSPWLIPWVIGEKWGPAIVPFQILCCVAVIQVLMSLSPPVFNGLGRPDLSMKWTVTALAFNSMGFVAGLKWGIRGVALGYLVAVALSFPIHIHLIKNVLNVTYRSVFLTFFRGIIVVSSAGIAVLLMMVFLSDKAHHSAWILSTSVVTVSLSFLVSALLLRDGWKLVRRAVATITSGMIPSSQERKAHAESTDL